MSLSLLLGAGFSKWAADLPVASQLFDFQIDAFGPRESNKLQSIKCLKTNLGMNLTKKVYRNNL